MNTRTKLTICAALAAAQIYPCFARADDGTHLRTAQAAPTAKIKPKKPKPLKLVRTEQWWTHAGTNSWLVYTKAKRTTIQVSTCDRKTTLPPYAVRRANSYFWVNVPSGGCLLFDVRQDRRAKFRMTPLG